MKNSKKKNSWFKKIDKGLIWISLTGTIGIFSLPYIVTQCSWGYNLEVEDSNAIGDTIGGVLSPFIGLLGAILVYLALKEQIKANNLIQKQFKKERKERFEKEIYQEVLYEIDSAIAIFKKFDGSTIKTNANKNNPPRNNSEIISELFSASIYEKFDNFHDRTEITLFTNNFNKITDNLEYFIANVRKEKAYLQIIKRRIDKIYEIWKLTPIIQERDNIIQSKVKVSSVLQLSKSSNFELIIRLLKVEKKLLEGLKDDQLELVTKQLEWYEKQFATLTSKLTFQRTLKSIYMASFNNEEEKRRDLQFIKKSKEEYEKYTTLLETENNKTENDFHKFLLEIKELSEKEGEIKYQQLEELIKNPRLFY